MTENGVSEDKDGGEVTHVDSLAKLEEVIIPTLYSSSP